MLPHVNGNKDDIEEEDNLSFAVLKNEKGIRAKWYDKILLNRPLRIILTLIIVSIIAPLLVYRYIFIPSLELPPSDNFSFGSCLVQRQSRIPCGIESVPPEQCHEQCCYDHQNSMCFHRYPSRFSYVFNGNWSENVDLNPRTATVPYANQRSLRGIRLSIDEISTTHLSLTFYHSDEIITGQKLEETVYEYTVHGPELNVIVEGPQGNIFNTAKGPLIASNNIWEISLRLTNETMYGLGEIPLKEDTVKIIYNHEGGMNSVPLIFAKFNDAYHGFLIETKAPTELIVRNDNLLVVRSITDWGLKFHLFVGPKPSDVMKDAMALLGVKKKLEYWMLGTHICRENTSPNPVQDLQTFITTANTQRLAYDSNCGTIPIVFNTECNATLVNQINQGTNLIRNARKKFVPHVSPHIKYTRLPEPEIENDKTTEIATRSATNRCFDDEKYEHYHLRDPDSNELYIGTVDEHDVIYPSYDQISEEFMKSLWLYNTHFEGVVLENNWPLDKTEKKIEDLYNLLPYFNENFEAGFNNTPQWNATRPYIEEPVNSNNNTETSTEMPMKIAEIFMESTTELTKSTTLPTTLPPGEKYFYTHNEYGNQFADAFKKIKGSIPILSTSQWMNGNVYINRQNIPTSWSSLQKELVEASLGGISGHWYWSSPICGDTEDFDNTTQVRLCTKWYMAATYMPMIKIHSKVTLRDPIPFVGTDKTLMLTALNRRMMLLPYLYSVIQEGPLLRPMFYQYPSCEDLKDLSTQFAVGDDLLIVPNLQPSQTHVHVWMPPGTWYEFWSGIKIDAKQGEAVTMSTTEADFLSLIRGGSVIAIQKTVQLTADLTRLQSPFSLIISLECTRTEITEDYEQTTDSAISDGDMSVTMEVTNKNIKETDQTAQDIVTTDANEEITTKCHAAGKLHMNENMSIKFKANSTAIKITALGGDFQVFCNTNVAQWSKSIREISVYGLDEEENNYDNHRFVNVNIDLCRLQNNDEIVFDFVN